MKRKNISKAVRFEVFKRDSFTCQYCGAKSPEVLLHVDHIQPVSGGGNNDILNLITACVSCNLGKSARALDDKTVLAKKRTQLEELQERAEQLEMIMRWQKGLLELERNALEEAAEYWESLVEPFALTQQGKSDLSKLLHKYPLSDVLDAMKISVHKWVEIKDGKRLLDSVNSAWVYVPKICGVKQADKEKPYLKDLLYIRGILRNRFSYCDERRAIEMLEEAYDLGADLEHLKRMAKKERNWSNWSAEMEALMQELGDSPPSSN